MIFAAGFGTRLQPITNNIPKALVEVNGKTLLQHSIENLEQNGVTHIVINVHHFADKVKEFVANYNGKAELTISDESEALLDTGGGLKHAARLFRGLQPVIVVNVDILTNLDLQQMYNYHLQTKSDITLAIRKRESSRQLLFNSQMQLKGWVNIKTDETILADNSSFLAQYAFSGVHIVSQSVFTSFPVEPSFPIIPHYLNLSISNKIQGYLHQEDYWFDVGTIKKLKDAEAFLSAL